MQRDMAALENRPSANRELVPAIVAQEHSGLRPATHLVNVEGAAMWAIGLAIRPAIGLHVGRGLGFVVKDRVSEVACHG